MNIKTLLLSMALAVSTSPLYADGEGKLNVQTVVQKETVVEDDAGNKSTQLVLAESVVPGEEVIYTVTYTNISSDTTDNIVISNPIPEQLTYVQGSAFGPGTEISFSVDGGKTYASPDRLIVVEEGLSRPATSNDFTNIRWIVQTSLQSGDRGFARFRARLN